VRGHRGVGGLPGQAEHDDLVRGRGRGPFFFFVENESRGGCGFAATNGLRHRRGLRRCLLFSRGPVGRPGPAPCCYPCSFCRSCADAIERAPAAVRARSRDWRRRVERLLFRLGGAATAIDQRRRPRLLPAFASGVRDSPQAPRHGGHHDVEQLNRGVEERMEGREGSRIPTKKKNGSRRMRPSSSFTGACSSSPCERPAGSCFCSRRALQKVRERASPGNKGASEVKKRGRGVEEREKRGRGVEERETKK